MRKHILLLSAAAMLIAGAAQAETFTMTTDNGRVVAVEVLNENVVKVTNTLPGEKVTPTGLTVLEAAPFTGQKIDTPTGMVITTPAGVTVTMQRSDGAVTVNAGHDRVVSDNGMRLLADGQRQLSLSTMGTCHFYGAGERGHALNLAGDSLVMYNRQNYGYTKRDRRISQMNITMPLFISSAGYAVLFDDYGAASMVMRNPVVYTTNAAEPIAWFFINGAGTPEGTVRQLSALTGRQDLPPLWSLGYITSKYGYRTESETRGVVDTLKRQGYPLDGVVLDLYWYGREEDMGRLAWDPEQWPTYRDMLADLKREGVNLVAISQPYVLTNGRGAANYEELAALGALVADSTGTGVQPVEIWVGEGGMFDVSSPAAQRWLRERYKALTDSGITGWWGDLGEPEVHPLTGRHANGLTAAQYHNKYGNDWSRIIYDLFREEYPDTRLMTLMRGGTTGLQRYSVFPWSTDVSRSWGGLQPQVTIMTQSGLSGLGYMSHDVGGFAVERGKERDAELYVRWLQLGLFSPVLRTHSQQLAEPYHYGEYADIIRPLILDRYRWLPYNYTLAYENASQGLPLVRPLNFYSGDTALDDIDDEYLWGRDVLVAPVMQQGATERRIAFPEGMWVDASDPAKIYRGGDVIEAYPAPLEVLPLFYRAGAFIPMAEYAMENTGDYRRDRYTVYWYPVEGVTSQYTLYEDDTQSTRSIANNDYALITFSGSDSAEGMQVSIVVAGSYAGAPERRSIDLVVENVAKPAAVRINGEKTKKGVRYDAKTRRLTVAVTLHADKPVSIDIAK